MDTHPTPPLLPTQPIPTPPTPPSTTGTTVFEFEASQRSMSDVSANATNDDHNPSAHATATDVTTDTEPDEPHDDVFWAHKATQHGLPEKTEYEALKFLDQARDPDLDAWYVQRKVLGGVLPIRSRPFVRLARGGYIDHLALVLGGSDNDNDFDMFTSAAIEVLEFARPIQGLHSFKALVRDFAATGNPIFYKPMRHLATIDSPHVALAFDFIVRARCA